MSCFISLEGCDGVGKSTVAQQIAGSRPECRLISKRAFRDSSEFIDNSLKGLSQLIWGDGYGRLDHTQLPTSYWLHLQAAWYSAFSQRAIKLHESVDPLLADGWYYKFCAKLMAGGYEWEFLQGVFKDAATPRQVILLDMSPEDVWERGREFNLAEMGMYAGRQALGRNSFIDYQASVREQLLLLALHLKWEVIAVGPEATLSETVQAVEDRISGVLGPCDVKP